MDLSLNKIHLMNCIDGLKLVKPKSVNTCVSSPPYYALRDYGIEPTEWPEVTYSLFGLEITIPAVNACLGLEATPKDYIGHMVYVYRLVRETLADNGTIWVNIGDSYAGGGGSSGHTKDTKNLGVKTESYGSIKTAGKVYNGIKPKDMIGIPWMLAFALREDGWYLRQDIIWHKTNCMPESCNDRCTKNHEYIFLLSKSNRYYFDQAAIATPIAESTKNDARVQSETYSDIRSERGFLGNPSGGTGMLKAKYKKPDAWDQREGVSHNTLEWATEKHQGQLNSRQPRTGIDTRVGNQGNGDIPAVAKGNRKTFRGGGAYVNNNSFDNSTDVKNDSVGNEPNITGFANKRSVWTVATYGFKEAHFATFPPALITDCIKAGCPVGGTVLDIFMGSGTTGIVASKLGRNFIGFEQNAKYLKIAERRMHKELGLFKPQHD